MTVSPSLVVYTQGEGTFTASIARRGYADEVAVRVVDLPDGVTVVPATIPSGQNEVEVTLKSTLTTPLEAKKLTVIAEATAAGLRNASIAPDAAAVLTEAPRRPTSKFRRPPMRPWTCSSCSTSPAA